MDTSKAERNKQFKQMVGKTIEKVDATCINEVTITCSDGSSYILGSDEQLYGIGVINITKAD